MPLQMLIYLNIVGSSLLQEPVFLQNILSAVIIPCFGYIIKLL